ncbi:MAG: Tetratricopeptide repeat protein [Syntrophorhabdus sp. PtaU1.Bin058]|nr:MAG: Tetratricopeptide repeat protein [Syntrophorhabdus sp. PtaU1.Bin058]
MKTITAIIVLLCIAVATTLAYHKIQYKWIIYREAETLYKKKEYKKAIPYYTSLLKKSFRDHVVLSRLGELYLAVSDLNNARLIYEEILRSEPLNMQTRITLADIYMRLGDYRKTINIYTMLLLSQPGNRHLHILMARALTAKGDFEDAITHYRIALGENQ